MRFHTYKKYEGSLLDALNLGSLMELLSDFLMDGGFAGGPGEDEVRVVTVPADGWYCLAVAKAGSADLPLVGEYLLRVRNGISAVPGETPPIPGTMVLHPAVPNPFNPSTTIRYGLPSRSHVTLTVFNALGQQVATLLQGEQEAGYHEVQFDASGLASGVYLYRLKAGDFVQAKKLMLVR